MAVLMRLAPLLALFLCVPALAILPTAPADTDTATDAVEQTIEQSPDAGGDARITDRLEEIFAELPAFANVRVSVSEGVVTLAGSTSDPGSIDRASDIATRVSGVVTVENQIERDLSVEENLSFLTKISDLFQDFMAALPLALVALGTGLAIAAIGYGISKLSFLWNRVAPNAFLGELIRTAIRFVFVIGGIVIALDILGAGALLGAVLGGAGVIGIALGFALRDTIENYVASLMLSLRQPFRANDHVLIDDREGRVIRLTSRATVLMTLDGNHLRIPNSQVFKAIIVNYSRNPQRRFDFELGIDADDDPRSAMKLGTEVLAGLSFVLNEPEPAARIVQVGDSNILIMFLAWVDQREADWLKSRSLAIASVKETLEDAGFALPEPIYRLRFDGRTDPLPIGRSSNAADAPPKVVKSNKAAACTADEDVKPETEISEMVDQERRADGDEAPDLLDHNRPVE